jgi:hypothetical protein
MELVRKTKEQIDREKAKGGKEKVRSVVEDTRIPLLEHEPSETPVFTAGNLLEAARIRHYMRPRRHADADPSLLAAVRKRTEGLSVPVHSGPSWTTDAPFRFRVRCSPRSRPGTCGQKDRSTLQRDGRRVSDRSESG